MEGIDQSQLKFLEGKKETSEKQDLDIAGLANSTNAIIKKHEDKLKELPPQFQDQLRNGIVRYFQTSADRYDQDSEKGLDVTEFERYKRDMLTKVAEIVATYSSSEGAIHEQEKSKEAASAS